MQHYFIERSNLLIKPVVARQGKALEDLVFWYNGPSNSWGVVPATAVFRYCVSKHIGLCHSPVDIHASARAGVCGSEREWAQIGMGVLADRCGSEHENQQENGKNQYIQVHSHQEICLLPKNTIDSFLLHQWLWVGYQISRWGEEGNQVDMPLKRVNSCYGTLNRARKVMINWYLTAGHQICEVDVNPYHLTY